MRDLCHFLKENQCLLEFHQDRHVATIGGNIRSTKQAEHVLRQPLSYIIVDSGLYGTKWFIGEKPKDIQYQSLACHVADVLNQLFHRNDIPLSADTLFVKEKSLGFDRALTVKITKRKPDLATLREHPELNDGSWTIALCYVGIQAEPCEVPKKQSNSRGVGMQINGLEFYTAGKQINPFPSATLYDLLNPIGAVEYTVASWLNSVYLGEISEAQHEMNLAIQQYDYGRMQDAVTKITSSAQALAEQVHILEEWAATKQKDCRCAEERSLI